MNTLRRRQQHKREVLKRSKDLKQRRKANAAGSKAKPANRF
jgi:hypothetical protein